MTKRTRRCEHCKVSLRAHGGLKVAPGPGEPRALVCLACYQEIISEAASPNSDWVTIQLRPFSVEDCQGIEHHFDLGMSSRGKSMFMRALEIRDGRPAGYEFSAAADIDEDPLELLRKLYEHMRRELGRKYLTANADLPQIGDQNMVRGTIGWDREKGSDVPLLVVDGRNVTWEEMGRMVMTYEGFAFKLEIFDLTKDK